MDMIHKNISSKSGSLLQYFLQKERSHFLYEEAFEALPGSSKSAVKQLLSDMTKRGLLMRPMEGKYWIIPFDRDPEDYMPDWTVLGAFLAGGRENYCGYYSALQIHNLTTQPSYQQQVVVSESMSQTELSFRGAQFRFIYHNAEHFFGYEKVWVTSFERVNCSDLEKTLVDCLFKPEYAFGIAEIGKALFRAHERLDYYKLLEYTIRFGSQAVMKRLGFLMELLGLDHPIVEKLLAMRTKSIILLETGMPHDGQISSRWSIKVNSDTETIISGIYS